MEIVTVRKNYGHQLLLRSGENRKTLGEKIVRILKKYPVKHPIKNTLHLHINYCRDMKTASQQISLFVTF